MTATEQRAFLPNFCGIRMVFAVVVTAELLAIVLTLAAKAPGPGFWLALSLRSLYVQWIALSASALLCALRVPISRLSHTSAGLTAWALILVVTGLAFLAADRLGVRGDQPFFAALFDHMAIAGIVAAVLLRYLYEQFRERQRELAESEARLQALQARIRPHFLFNSMNTIASLTREDPGLAEQVVEDLSDLFRASLSDPGRLSTLDRELDLARGYLRIEAQRLGDRLVLHWDLEDLPGEAPIPSLLVQPLLENAIYHGVEPSASGGEVWVSGRCRGDVVTLAVRNTVPDVGGSSHHRQGNRMAQENVRARLEAAFGDSAGLVIGSVDGCYQVRVHFPRSVA